MTKLFGAASSGPSGNTTKKLGSKRAQSTSRRWATRLRTAQALDVPHDLVADLDLQLLRHARPRGRRERGRRDRRARATPRPSSARRRPSSRWRASASRIELRYSRRTAHRPRPAPTDTGREDAGRVHALDGLDPHGNDGHRLARRAAPPAGSAPRRPRAGPPGCRRGRRSAAPPTCPRGAGPAGCPARGTACRGGTRRTPWRGPRPRSGSRGGAGSRAPAATRRASARARCGGRCGRAARPRPTARAARSPTPAAKPKPARQVGACMQAMATVAATSAAAARRRTGSERSGIRPSTERRITTSGDTWRMASSGRAANRSAMVTPRPTPQAIALHEGLNATTATGSRPVSTRGSSACAADAERGADDAARRAPSPPPAAGRPRTPARPVAPRQRSTPMVSMRRRSSASDALATAIPPSSSAIKPDQAEVAAHAGERARSATPGPRRRCAGVTRSAARAGL